MNSRVWAIEDIFLSISDWEKEYLELKDLINFDSYKGKLGSAESFLEYLKAEEKIGRRLEKLQVYAMMMQDSDAKNSLYDTLSSKAMGLCVKFSSETSFVTPELTALDESVIKGYIADKRFADYDYSLSLILKAKAHILSENEEKLLASAGETFSSFREIFSKIDNADLPLKPLKYGKQTIPMSHGMYGVIMHGEDRALRKAFFKKYYSAYVSLINTITSTYYGSVKKNVFYAKAKKYDSALDLALKNEDVDKLVYDNLIKWTNKSLPTLHKYVRVKKNKLNLKSMHMYDMYVPTEKDAELKLEYDDAYDLVVEGLSVLGKEYTDLLRKAHDERWIDVDEREGKRSGAYSVAVYDTHPYVLLNYQKTTHDVFTIAHEMGHSLHSYFSNRTQSYSKADYKIFVAEVASTVNEVLLLYHLLDKATDVNLKKYLLSYLLEMIRTTLFRQTKFSEFEEFAHTQVENGIPLTKDLLNQKYLELNKKYYGKSVISDDEIKYEWARIPHFYRAFYVYKYATGIISALAIVDRIKNEGQTAVKDYFEFLSSGGSQSPTDLLKKAGVDLTTDKPFKSAFEVFRKVLEEYSSLQ